MNLNKADYSIIIFFSLIFLFIESIYLFNHHYVEASIIETQHKEIFCNEVHLFLINEEKLVKISGVGPVTAQKIKEYSLKNNTGNFADLIKINGIGIQIKENIQDYYEKSKKI
ncbi:MAG: hypothetical protein ACQESP_03750 [Candidatus Muiribacteriota bacterium]